MPQLAVSVESCLGRPSMGHCHQTTTEIVATGEKKGSTAARRSQLAACFAANTRLSSRN
jgi:hypothetical protein